MNSTKLTFAALTAVFSFAGGAFADMAIFPPASTKTNVTYATDIKPIFDASCVKCHSGDRAKAHLHMDTLEGVLKGAKQGKIVTPGDSTNSLIIKSIAYLSADRDTWMPPMNNKAGIKQLTPEQISLVRAWIDQGTK